LADRAKETFGGMIVGTVVAETMERKSSPVDVGGKTVVGMITEDSTLEDVTIEIEVGEMNV